MYETGDSSYVEDLELFSDETLRVITIILLVVLAISLLFAIICAAVAIYKKRSGVAWFFIGFMLGMIGFVIICCLNKVRPPKVADEIEKLSELRQRGIISQREFEKRKRELFRK